jgi:tRNA A37 threonylcarbamoyladenosine dehydratase
VALRSDLPNACGGEIPRQFYLAEEHVGKNRAESSRPKLQELNPRVSLNVHTGVLAEDFLRKFKARPFPLFSFVMRSCH